MLFAEALRCVVRVSIGAVADGLVELLTAGSHIGGVAARKKPRVCSTFFWWRRREPSLRRRPHSKLRLRPTSLCGLTHMTGYSPEIEVTEYSRGIAACPSDSLTR